MPLRPQTTAASEKLKLAASAPQPRETIKGSPCTPAGKALWHSHCNEKRASCAKRDACMRSCTPQLSAHHAPPEHTAAVQIEHTQLKHIAPPNGETHLGKLHHLCCGVRSGRHRKRSRRQHSSGGQRSLRKRQSKLSAIAIGRRFAAHSARPKRTTNTQLHLRCVNIKKPGSPDAAAASARQPLPGWPPGALPQASVRPCAGRGVSPSRTSRRREPWRMGSACGEASSASHYLRNPDFGTDFKTQSKQLHDACRCYVVAPPAPCRPPHLA